MTNMTRLGDMNHDREYEAVWHLVSALAALCSATPEMVIDRLTNCLWLPDEAEAIKVSRPKN